MADDKDPKEKDQAADSPEQQERKKNRKKLFLFVGLVVLLIGVSIGGTLLAVKLLAPPPPVEVALDEEGNPIDPEAEAEEEAAKPKAPAIYYPLKPPLLVNYQARGRQRFLQAEVTVMARDDEVIEAVEIHMPMIRNSLIMLFSGQNYEDLQTDEGRELLRQSALMELQAIMEREIGKPGVEKVLFTNLVMQ